MALCRPCKDIFAHEDLALMDADELKMPSQYEDSSEYYAAKNKGVREHQEDISSMADYASQGCYICGIVWRHFFPDKKPADFLANPFVMRVDRMGNQIPHIWFRSGTWYQLCKPDSTCGSYSKETVELRIGLNSPIAQDRHIPEYKSLILSPTDDEESCSMMQTIMITPSESIFGDNTWLTISKWVHDCITTHSDCVLPMQNPPWLPTRLIDVQARLQERGPNFEDDSAGLLATLVMNHDRLYRRGLKLIETTGAGIKDGYITLSHRWQRRPSLLLERGNLDSMKQQIRYEDLNLVFQQAIDFCRKVGVRYLWIDSLCIVQDDERDKIVEIEQMGQVYSNAFMNISATAGGGRLQQPRNPDLISPYIITPRWKIGTERRPYVVTDFRFWDERIYNSLTNKRAWITQERWLSPRVLHFAFDQLVWECRQLEACETFPGGLPCETRRNKHTGFKCINSKKHTDDLHFLFSGPTGQPPLKDIDNHEYAHQDWTKVLETYARTEAGNINDRVTAISIIAQQLAPRLNDEFIAGLWRKTLPGDLLWLVYKMRRSNWLSNELYSEATDTDWDSVLLNRRKAAVGQSSRLQAYQAPSWSWASVLGDINPGPYILEDDERVMIKIRDVVVEPKIPGKHYSGIRSASLRLRGRLYPIAMEPPRYKWDVPTLYLDGLPMEKAELEGKVLDFETRTHRMNFFDADQSEEWVDVARSCFLPIYWGVHFKSPLEVIGMKPKDEAEEQESKNYVSGLVLLPTGKQGEYSRIGMEEMSGKETRLFLMGFESQKNGYRDLNEGGHARSLDPSLYEEGDLGAFTIV